jgi:hypothetical protein
MKTKYMHTINGHPAVYYQREQICFLGMGRELVLADSLKQIRKEQIASYNWRLKEGFKGNLNNYGYLRIKI